MLHVQSGGGLLGPVRLEGIDPSSKLVLSSTVEGGEVVVEVTVGWKRGSLTGSGTVKVRCAGGRGYCRLELGGARSRCWPIRR